MQLGKELQDLTIVVDFVCKALLFVTDFVGLPTGPLALHVIF